MTVNTPQAPDAVFVWPDAEHDPVRAGRAGTSWAAADVEVRLTATGLGLRVDLAASGPVALIALRWKRPAERGELVLGDAWERSYGDLGWQPIRPERVLPWYWLATSAAGVRAAGVRVRPGAMCFWTVDEGGETLWLDVRSGRDPVRLGARGLHAATVVAVSAPAGTPVVDAERELTTALCSDALQPTSPLVGCNNWYYAYGRDFGADAVVRDAAMISEAAGGHAVRPLCVIDAGWSKGTSGAPGGPWTHGAGSFADMTSVADRIRGEGARPGLWMRPLLTSEPGPLTRDVTLDAEWPMDPSRHDVLDQVGADIRRLVGWGYELIKHDFSTFDILGHFVPASESLGMSAVPWSFSDTSRTTAEVIVRLYEVIRDAAGDAEVLGCNTVGHLAAGLVQAQRIGDDTSGRHWERTRRMGVNTIGFRIAQHGTFFAADADCVPSTTATPWEKNRQFLELVAASGTPLFVSIDPTTRNADVDADVRAAVRLALDGGQPGGASPLDQTETSAPRRWWIGGEVREFDWGMDWGVDQSLAAI